MKHCLSAGLRALSLVVLLLLLKIITCHGKSTDSSHSHIKDEKKDELGMELYPTGSRLPDCSHACGPCLPCKRVMVSFKCSVAESCPIVYRCMCKGKCYHVPSNQPARLNRRARPGQRFLVPGQRKILGVCFFQAFWGLVLVSLYLLFRHVAAATFIRHGIVIRKEVQLAG